MSVVLEVNDRTNALKRQAVSTSMRLEITCFHSYGAGKAKIDAHEHLMLQAERYLDRPFVSLQTSPMQTWRA